MFIVTTILDDIIAFFAKKVVEDGEVMFYPTTAGYIGLMVLILIAMIVASFFIGKKNGSISAKQMAISAICMALAFITSNIKLFRMPMSGSVTLLSMFFICLIGYWYGIRAGVLSGIAYGLLQLIVNPYILTLPQMLVDYPLAFGALGLSGIGYHIKKTWDLKVMKFGGLQIGYVVGVLGRYFFTFISGWIFFGEYAWDGWSAIPYSLVYNGLYLGAEAIITLIVIAVEPVSSALSNAKKIVNN